MLKANELRDQSVEELEAVILDLRQELFAIHNERKMNQKLDHPHLLNVKRKDIARVLTVLREKQLAS